MNAQAIASFASRELAEVVLVRAIELGLVRNDARMSPCVEPDPLNPGRFCIGMTLIGARCYMTAHVARFLSAGDPNLDLRPAEMIVRARNYVPQRHPPMDGVRV